MKEESILAKILRKIGIVRYGMCDDKEAKREMCERAVKSNMCSKVCSSCAWNTEPDEE